MKNKKVGFIVTALLVSLSLSLIGCKTEEEKNIETVKKVLKEDGKIEALAKFNELFPLDKKTANSEDLQKYSDRFKEVFLNEKPKTRDENDEEFKQALDAENNRLEEENKVTVEKVESKNVTDNLVKVATTIKNDSENKIRYIKIMIEILDKNGDIIDSEWTNATDIPAKSNKIIDKSIMKNPNASKYRVGIEEIDF